MDEDTPLSKFDAAAFLHVGAPVALELKAEPNAEPGTISGFASTFGGPPDGVGDIIEKGAYRRSLEEWRQFSSMPAMLWSHIPEEVAGRWISMTETDKGLACVGRCNLKTRRGAETFEHCLARDTTTLSIGFNLYERGWRHNPNGTRSLLEIDLREVSVVAMACNRYAQIHTVKSGPHTRADVEAALSQHLPGRLVKKLMRGGWPALSTEDDEPDPQQFAPLVEHVRRATERILRWKP